MCKLVACVFVATLMFVQAVCFGLVHTCNGSLFFGHDGAFVGSGLCSSIMKYFACA